MHQKSDLQRAINDIKKINIDYGKKEDQSSILVERLKEMETELLDRYFSEATSKPVARKGPKRRAKNIVGNASENAQL